MLSFTLPTVTETITLNGLPLVVSPLPLFFRERITRACPAPDKASGPAYTSYLLRVTAAEVVEVLGESEALQRPAWTDAEAWPEYLERCEDALVQAGLLTSHIHAIQDAVKRLEARSTESLEQVGNS